MQKSKDSFQDYFENIKNNLSTTLYGVRFSINTAVNNVKCDKSLPVPETNVDSLACLTLHNGSYMSSHVLLNLSNELRKNDKMLAC